MANVHEYVRNPFNTIHVYGYYIRECMLEIDSVELNFGVRRILCGCYINCKPGEVVGLLGRNGSGKSCLLKIIFGILRANHKHLVVDGNIVYKGYKSGLIAYLPQNHFIAPFIKVKDVLKKAILNQPFILDNIVIQQILDQKTGDLSSGELRLVECIWILNHKAPYILLDEPFSGLSPLIIEFLQFIIKKTGERKGIIFTDHNYRCLVQISNRVVLLHNNSIYKIKNERDLAIYNYIPTSHENYSDIPS